MALSGLKELDMIALAAYRQLINRAPTAKSELISLART